MSEMKYKDGYYIQLSRCIFEADYKYMSDSAKWFYCYLTELEHRHTGKEKQWFYRTDNDIAEDLNWSVSKVQRIKKELSDFGFIKIMKTHSKTSTRHLTAYEIIK